MHLRQLDYIIGKSVHLNIHYPCISDCRIHQACMSFDYTYCSCIYILQYVCFITLGMYVLWTFIIHACLTVAIQQACLSFEYPCMSGCCNTAGMPVYWISMHVCLLYYSRHVWQTWSVLWIYYTCIYVCCITSVMHVLWISMHANYRLNMFDQYIYIIRNCAKFYHLKLVIHLLWLRLV